MNANNQKEIRMLLPAFGVSLLLVIGMSWLLTVHDAAEILTMIFAPCCAWMAATSFGVEFQSRTMPQILSQPVSRQSLWHRKMAFLLAALGLALLILLVSVSFLSTDKGKAVDFGAFAGTCAMLALCAFCSTPAWTLMSRNFMFGIVTSILGPFVLIGLVMACVETVVYYIPQPAKDWFRAWVISMVMPNGIARPSLIFPYNVFNHHPYVLALIPCLIYCGFFYRLGYGLFLRFEAIEIQRKEISIRLPRIFQRALAPMEKIFMPGYSGPIASLVRKELHLHRVSYFLAGLVIVLLPLEAIAESLHDSDLIEGVLGATFGIYVILVPVITGVVSVADERNWGTVPWQLTLPISAKTQAAVKICFTLATGILLGIILPEIFLDAGKFLFHLPINGFLSASHSNDWAAGFGAKEFTALLVYLFGFSTIIFASSLCRDSIRAITVAVGLCVAFGLAYGFGNYSGHYLSKLIPFLVRVAATLRENERETAWFFSEILLLFLGSLLLLFSAYRNSQKNEVDFSKKILSLTLMIVVCWLMGFAWGVGNLL